MRRISIAAIVNLIRNPVTGESRYLGFLNKGSWTKRRERLFTALAGGMLAWDEGEQYLMGRYGADFKDADREDGGIDLRFFVEDDVAEAVLTEFDPIDPVRYETPLACMWRDVGAELTTAEIAGLQDVPVLTGEAMRDEVRFVYRRPYRQPAPDDGVGTSANAGAIPSIRLFFLCDMEVSDRVWRTLEGSPLCAFFTADEAALTGGGRRRAEVRGLMLGDNILIAE